MLSSFEKNHFCFPILKPISNTDSIYVTSLTFGKVNVEFRRMGPLADRKLVTNPKPPQELVFLFFRFYPRSDDEAEPFIGVYEQRNKDNPSR